MYWNADGNTALPPKAHASRSIDCSYRCGYESSIGSSTGSASKQTSRLSSPSSPIPSRHPLTIAAADPRLCLTQTNHKLQRGLSNILLLFVHHHTIFVGIVSSGKQFCYSGRQAWVCAGQDEDQKKIEKWAKVWLEESEIYSCVRYKGGYKL